MTPADDDDDALEGERYQGVRDLFRKARDEGFDEEPPARLDALLMAAARAHAPKKTTFLERLRRWLVSTMMQPAVAGAVMIAVIGGTAGVLYMKGKGGVAEPTVGAPARDPAQAPPPAEEQMLRDAVRDLPSSDPVVTTSSDNAELEAALRQLEADQRRREQPVMPEPRERPKGEQGPGGGGGGGGGETAGSDGNVIATEKTPVLEYKPDERDTATVVTAGSTRGGGGGGGGGAVGGVKTAITGSGDTPPPPPPPPDVTIASDDEVISKEREENVGATAQTEGRSTTTRPSTRAQAENLLRQARTAARNNNCAAVRTMAKRAKQLDAAYYNATFSRDPDVKICL